MLWWVLCSILMLFGLRSRKHVYNTRKMSGAVYNGIMWYTRVDPKVSRLVPPSAQQLC